MRMPEPGVQRQPIEDEEEEQVQTKPVTEQITPLVQRQVEEEEEELVQIKPVIEQITPLVQRQAEEEEELLQTKGFHSQSNEIKPSLTTRIQNLKGGGQPLPESTRAHFESRFGQDFSKVRVHADSNAVEAARAVNARAFTVGRDIVLGKEQYAPWTEEGRKLLAHELTHTLQQDGAAVSSDLATKMPHSAHEREAKDIKSGGSVQVSSTTRTIQRACLPQARCPIMSIDIGGVYPRCVTAEKCLQDDYRDEHIGNVISFNKQWFTFTGRPKPEQEDIDCFKPHFVALSAMYPAEPDIFDFTETSMYEITTWKQQLKRWKRGKFDAQVHIANQLAKDTHLGCSGRYWFSGAWTPSPCYWVGGDLYMRVANIKGILTYQMLQDVSKETLTAALLAAIYKTLKDAGKLAPPAALAYAMYKLFQIKISAAPRFAFASAGGPPVPASGGGPAPPRPAPAPRATPRAVPVRPAPAPNAPMAAPAAGRLLSLGARAGLIGAAAAVSVFVYNVLAKYTFSKFYKGTRGWKLLAFYKRLGLLADRLGYESVEAVEWIALLSSEENPDSEEWAGVRSYLFDVLYQLRLTVYNTAVELSTSAKSFSAIHNQLDSGDQFGVDLALKIADDIIASGSHTFSDLIMLHLQMSHMVSLLEDQMLKLVDNHKVVFRTDVRNWMRRRR